MRQWTLGSWAYEWNANGSLKSVKKASGQTISFEYDALGRRTAKRSGNKEILYIWSGNVLLHEVLKTNDNEQVITWVYEQGNFVPTTKLIDGEAYSIVSDYLGTPIRAYDEEGNLVWERELDIYGKVKTETKESANFVPFRYQGQYYDSEVDLCYNRFRYYDCNTGSYISQDPISILGGLNIYAYVYDVNSWVDVFGLTGTYMFTDGKIWYIGKGDTNRMNASMKQRVGGKTNVIQGVHIDYGNNQTGLMVEAELMRRNDAVADSKFANKINSPGKKMLENAKINHYYDDIMKKADDFEIKFNKQKGIKCH
ncbi:RHS repeat domain-containing protein [Capnocytophaga canimorsus]|uniref:RHS repeat domain-containing protein n=1 Tax=Capnocytophaga canimorsus TaxID=28188 RepID=UPI00385C0108